MIGEGRQQALQEHVRRLKFGQPELPVDKAEAILRACDLRLAGLSYTAVARVMAMYHGWYYSPAGWRYLVRQAGLPHARGPVR